MARGIWECGWEVGHQGRLLWGRIKWAKIGFCLYKLLRSHLEYWSRLYGRWIFVQVPGRLIQSQLFPKQFFGVRRMICT